MRSLSTVVLGSVVLVSACVGEVTAPDPIEIEQGFHLLRADDSGVLATYMEGDVAFIMQSRATDDGMVVASVRTDSGEILTQLTVPRGQDVDVRNLGALARASAERIGMAPARAGELVAPYDEALQQLFVAADRLGRSTVLFSLLWQEEVLIRMLPPDPTITSSEDLWYADQVYDLDNPNDPVHTTLMYSPHVTSFRNLAHKETFQCDLHCAWWDVCCHHDQACVYCNHWYCGWDCCPGCFGGDCGGCR